MAAPVQRNVWVDGDAEGGEAWGTTGREEATLAFHQSGREASRIVLVLQPISQQCVPPCHDTLHPQWNGGSSPTRASMSAVFRLPRAACVRCKAALRAGGSLGHFAPCRPLPNHG